MEARTINRYLEQYYQIREGTTKKNYIIEDPLFIKLEAYAKYYEATMTQIVNLAIKRLIETEEIRLYEKKPNTRVFTHTFSIRESNIEGLENLSEKYGLSIYKLVNIALNNLIRIEEEKEN